MKLSKGSDIINKVYSENWKEWIAEKDFKTCAACRILDGKIYGINELVFPAPPLHPNCRCRIETTQVILKKDADYYVDTIVASGRSVYSNIDGRLPDAPGRTWYEADAVNIDGNKGAERILYSSDGLIFVTYDHYKTFVEVARSDDVMSWQSNRMFESSDPYVGNTANAIELKFPGRIEAVNKIVKDNTGRIITDYDIELDNVIIQVKSGSAKGLTTQIKNTAQSTNKEVIGYTPDLNPSSAVVKGVQNEGYECFTTLQDLLDYLAEK